MQELPNSVLAEAYSELCLVFGEKLTVQEAYSERSQTSKMKLFEKNISSHSSFTKKVPS